MMTSLWAHAVIYPEALGAKEALSMADLDWPPLVAELFEEGGPWACKGTFSSNEEVGIGQSELVV